RRKVKPRGTRVIRDLRVDRDISCGEEIPNVRTPEQTPVFRIALHKLVVRTNERLWTGGHFRVGWLLTRHCARTRPVVAGEKRGCCSPCLDPRSKYGL